MFDGGLNLDLKQMVKTAHFAFILAILGFILSVAIAAFAVHFILDWTWMESILLGSIVGGSSSAIVFGLVRNIRISDETKNMLSFESALTDILATIIAFILFGAILAGQFDIQVLEETLGRAIVVGLVLGFRITSYNVCYTKLLRIHYNFLFLFYKEIINCLTSLESKREAR